MSEFLSFAAMPGPAVALLCCASDLDWDLASPICFWTVLRRMKQMVKFHCTIFLFPPTHNHLSICWQLTRWFPFSPSSLPFFLRRVFLREYDASRTPFRASSFLRCCLLNCLTCKLAGSKLNVESSRWSIRSFRRSWNEGEEYDSSRTTFTLKCRNGDLPLG